MSKRYLVYFGQKPIGGIDGYDYQNALLNARLKCPNEYKKLLRIRLANKPGTLLWSLAQNNF